MMTTHGIVLDRSTLAFWVGYAAAELAPVSGRLKACLLSSAKINGDDGPCAGSWTRTDEDRLLLGNRPR